MASVFPPWSDTALRIAVFATVVSGAAAILGLMVYVRTPWRRSQFEPVDQPVQFDHRHHAQDDGIDCLYCHKGATQSAFAGVPSTELCMGCHSQIWNQSPKLAPVRQSYFSGEPIRWRRVHNVPDFAYFNHAIHVNKGVGCASCHGRVDQMGQVYQVASLTMGWCLDCHRHPEEHLRPLDQITNMAWSAGEDQPRIGRYLAQKLGVRSLTNCTACHR